MKRQHPYHRPPETAAELLRRFWGMGFWFTLDSPSAASLPSDSHLDLCRLIERANMGKVAGEAHLHRHGDPEVLAEAKAILCRRFGVVHLSLHRGSVFQ